MRVGKQDGRGGFRCLVYGGYVLSSRGGCQVLDSLYNVRNNIEGLVSLDDGARVL